MKVYLDLKFRSRGIERVITALIKYKPDHIEIVHSVWEADLIIAHIIGRRDHMTNWLIDLLEHGKHYVVIQYALESTRNPHPEDWLEFWKEAELVWSYYDLKKYIGDKLYHAPLAAEPEQFFPVKDTEKRFMVGTSGESYQIECVGEVRHAAWDAQGKTVHIGRPFDADPNSTYCENVSDDELRLIYNQTDWWSCLRRKDGFELGAVEAMMCGIRPLMFDTPNYRQWYDGLAQFVPECEPSELTGRLKRIFLDGPQPLSEKDLRETKLRFNWMETIDTFWNSVLSRGNKAK